MYSQIQILHYEKMMMYALHMDGWNEMQGKKKKKKAKCLSRWLKKLGAELYLTLIYHEHLFLLFYTL